MNQSDIREAEISSTVWNWPMTLGEAMLLIAGAQERLDVGSPMSDDQRLRLQNVIDRHATIAHRLREQMAR